MKEKECPLKPRPKLNLSYEEYMRLPWAKRYQLEITEPKANWRRVNAQENAEKVEWTPELRNAVMRGITACTACGGSGHFFVLEYSDASGIFRNVFHHCLCKQLQYLWTLLSPMIPLKYQFADIWTLKPSEDNQMDLQAQQAELDFIRQHQDESFFLSGEPGTGKTTLAYALLRRAYERNLPHFWRDGMRPPYGKTIWLWRVNFDSLMRQFQEQATNREAPEPDVTPFRIEDAARRERRPVLIIEEIDKARQTEFRANKLFALIDALYAAKGQLVITTNLTLEKFDQMFSKSDNEAVTVAGDALMRRIAEMCNVRSYFTNQQKG